MLNSLEGLIRSGRLSKSLGWIAGLFRLKPLVHIDVATGKPKVIGAAFSKRSAWRKLTNQLNLLQNKIKLKVLRLFILILLVMPIFLLNILNVKLILNHYILLKFPAFLGFILIKIVFLSDILIRKLNFKG